MGTSMRYSCCGATPTAKPYTFLITYDIAGDERRAAISDLLADHGTRVQYCVFEIALPAKTRAPAPPPARPHRPASSTGLIDRDEDQVRLYPLPALVLNELVILGNHRIEERTDFWIL